MGRFRKSSATQTHIWRGHHRFEHWYRDNSLYFITSKCRDGFAAFDTEAAKRVFWDRFDFYVEEYRIFPIIETLMNNHYHSLSYVKAGDNVGPFMQHLHGSVAKLVNDLLPRRHLPFWRTRGNKDYFDGCLRSELQLRRTYRYVLLQAVRAGIAKDYRDYPHTRVHIELEDAVQRAAKRDVYLPEVPYARYDKRKKRGR